MAYIKQLTFLRFIAAISIVIFHYGNSTWPFNNNFVSKIISEGPLAVSFFFFLSGVVLGLNYLEKEKVKLINFYKKRFARIYPVYFLAFFTTLILGMVLNGSFPKGLSIIAQVLSLHAWIPGICLEINYPSWSISVEVFFYLMFPILLPLFKKLSLSKVALISIAIWLISFAQHNYFREWFYDPIDPRPGHFNLYFPVWHLNTFIMGICCAKYILTEQKKESKTYLKHRIHLLLGISILSAILLTDNYIKPRSHNGLLSPIFFLIISSLALDKSLLTRFLGNRFFILLGNSSYSIYLLQHSIYLILLSAFGLEKLEGISFFIFLTILTLVSIFIYKAFESKVRKIILGIKK